MLLIDYINYQGGSRIEDYIKMSLVGSTEIPQHECQSGIDGDDPPSDQVDNVCSFMLTDEMETWNSKCETLRASSYCSEAESR